VWLVSDLHDEPSDRDLVQADAKAYRQDGIALHVVGLNASRADTRFFSRLVGSGEVITPFGPTPPRAGAKQRFPTGLVAAAVVLALLLAANELLSTPLRWRQPTGPGPAAQASRGASA
jgi:hypothetical protein